jgi:NAD(P)-dependent dehydrogenase (short-subunit alcohol dehydrogenase family)
MSKTILITGAGSGFGKGAAIALAARGQLNAMYGLANVVSLPMQVRV